MNYKIYHEEIVEAFKKTSDWKTNTSVTSKITQAEDCVKMFVENRGVKFEGTTAMRLRSYFAEGPLLMLMLLKELIIQYNDWFQIYQGGFLDYDQGIRMVLPEQELLEEENWLRAHKAKFDAAHEKINSLIRQADCEFLNISQLSTHSIPWDYDDIIHRVKTLREDVGRYEYRSKADVQQLRDMLEGLKAFVEGCKAVRPAGSGYSYTPGSIFNSEWGRSTLNTFAQAMYDRAVRQGEVERGGLQLKAYEYGLVVEAQMREEWEAAMAKARATQGWIRISISAVVVIIAIGAIVASLGAATPLIAAGGATAVAGGVMIGAVVVGGACYVGYNISNMYEGIGDVYYGSRGDATTEAYNPGRDWMFGGNQQAWDIFGLVSGVVMSAGAAGIKAGVAALNAGITDAAAQAMYFQAGRVILDAGAAYAGAYYGTMLGNSVVGEEWGWTFGIVGAVFAASIMDMSVQWLDKSFNLSGQHLDFFKEMNAEDKKKYERFWDQVENGVEPEDRVKLNQWFENEHGVDAKQYMEFKDIYDNPKFFNQETGARIYPGDNGDPNVRGFLDGLYKSKDLQPGMKIDRFGGEKGEYFGDVGDDISQRSLPPGTNLEDYHQYEVLKPLRMQTGEVAPWFDQPGGGTQYWNGKTVEDLIEQGYLRDITDYLFI